PRAAAPGAPAAAPVPPPAPAHARREADPRRPGRRARPADRQSAGPARPVPAPVQAGHDPEMAPRTGQAQVDLPADEAGRSADHPGQGGRARPPARAGEPALGTP